MRWMLCLLAAASAVFAHGTHTAGTVEEDLGNTEIEASPGMAGLSWTSAWEGRHVHYGVDETGPGGAWTNELGWEIGDFSLSAWSGFGSQFTEWDFTASYAFDAGPLFLVPGYNLRLTPRLPADESTHHHEEAHHGEEDEEEHSGEESGHADHSHKAVGNELFVVLGTTKIPYVTPSVALIWDLNTRPGGFVECRLDGDIPLRKGLLWLRPYALLGLNIGYNTNEAYGWNNIQFGGELVWRVQRHVEIFAGVNGSIPMEVLDEIGQPGVAWANTGVRVSF